MDGNRDVRRIKGMLERFPDLDVWFVGGKLDQSRLAKMKLEQNGIKFKPLRTRLFTQNKNAVDGLNPHNALIILCEKWWENPVADTDAFRWYLREAMFVKQVGEI